MVPVSSQANPRPKSCTSRRPSCRYMSLRVVISNSPQAESAKAVSVENIVTQNHRSEFASQELLAKNESLRQAVGTGLNLVAEADAKLAAIIHIFLFASSIYESIAKRRSNSTRGNLTTPPLQAINSSRHNLSSAVFIKPVSHN